MLDATIRDLLADCLRRHGIEPSTRIEIAGDPAVGQRIWAAFHEFAALPVDGLHPGLHVPGPGRSDTDWLSLEARLEPRPATTNTPARPPSALLGRQLYLVDADEEFVDIDDATLRLVLDDAFAADPATARTAIFGGGASGAADWIARVEGSAVWQAVLSSGQLSHAVLE